MKTSEQIISEIKSIFATNWKTRDGAKIPEPEEVALGNDAVRLDGTVLYADLVDSTGLVDGHHDWFAAEAYKAYLQAASYVIRNNGGVITAFDGDRVMAVYIGRSKNSSAARTALQINYIVRKINATIKSTYSDTSYRLKQKIGIDSSPLFIARTGIRKSNDLVWVGRAANYAAKMCAFNDPDISTYITESVYTKLSRDTKYGGQANGNMWEKDYWPAMGISIYKSDWWWEF